MVEQEKPKQGFSLPKRISLPKWAECSLWVYITLTLAWGGVSAYYLIPMLVRSEEQRRYAMEHFDPNAISYKELLEKGISIDGTIVYRDLDNDKDYDTILKRKNSDGKYVGIIIRKGLEGKLEFPNLSETAVDPFHIPKNPGGLKLDYVDINKDGKLETITYLGLNDKTLQKINIERIDGKYVLSNL